MTLETLNDGHWHTCLVRWPAGTGKIDGVEVDLPQPILNNMLRHEALKLHKLCESFGWLRKLPDGTISAAHLVLVDRSLLPAELEALATL